MRVTNLVNSSALTPRRLALSIAVFLGGLGWYASPDFLIETRHRRLFRLALMPLVTVLTCMVISDTISQVRSDISSESPDQDSWEMNSDNVELDLTNMSGKKITGLALGLAALTSLGICFEVALFRRGERRRLQGVKFAHTRQAIPLAALCTAGYFLDDAQSA